MMTHLQHTLAPEFTSALKEKRGKIPELKIDDGVALPALQ